MFLEQTATGRIRICRSKVCIVLTCSALAEVQSKSAVRPGDLEELSYKLQTSLGRLGNQHTGCWCCPVCRLIRTTRCSESLSDRVICKPGSDHRDPWSLEALPMPPKDTDIYSMNEESVTEVSVLSAEESCFFTGEQKTSIRSGSFRHFEVESQHHYVHENVYSETVFPGTGRISNVPHQNSPLHDSFVNNYSDNYYTDVKRPSYDPTEFAYSKTCTRDLRPPHWPPQYMSPSPLIPHEYRAPSPTGTPFTTAADFTPSFNSEGLTTHEVSRQKRKVRFSDNIKVRILFAGGDGGDGEIIIDTQLVATVASYVFSDPLLRSCFALGPIRVVVYALLLLYNCWMFA